jgi:hypothetical protein
MNKCKKCGSDTIMVEYGYPSKNSYDGISEYRCLNKECGLRIGRWSGKELAEGEEELRYGGNN